MTPLERAKRAVEGWDYWRSHSHNANVLLMNIKREIEEATQEAYERGVRNGRPRVIGGDVVKWCKHGVGIHRLGGYDCSICGSFIRSEETT